MRIVYSLLRGQGYFWQFSHNNLSLDSEKIGGGVQKVTPKMPAVKQNQFQSGMQLLAVTKRNESKKTMPQMAL